MKKGIAIENSYGNVDLTRTTLSGRYAHVQGKRLGPLCDKLKIRYAKALVGFYGSKKYGYRPEFDGVVVSARSVPKLTEAIRERDERAARRREESVKSLSVLAALFTLNRRAKRCRDAARTYYQYGMHGFAGKAREEKEGIYHLKGQTLHYLAKEGVLRRAGYHRFEGGEDWAEMLTGGGYTFHRPCSPQSHEAEVRAEIEAQPKGAKEPALSVAYEVVERYLEGRPEVPVYSWPVRARSYRPDEWDEDEWDEDERELEEWDED